MSDNWNSYFCKVNDRLASIFVDIGIRQVAPDEARPWLLWVWVYFNQPRLDGLSSQDEFQTLVSLEDKLVQTLQQDCDAVLSGRITTDGRREFYFYGSRPEEFDERVHSSLASFHAYKFDLGKKRDPAWTQYLNVLYPTEEQFQLIGNRDLLDSMKKRGDALQQPRTVCHWLYFNNQADRLSFRSKAEALGYQVRSETETPGEDRAFGIVVERMQDMSYQKVNEAVMELFQASKSAHGEYDGWECELIVAPNPKRRKPWWKLWN